MNKDFKSIITTQTQPAVSQISQSLTTRQETQPLTVGSPDLLGC